MVSGLLTDCRISTLGRWILLALIMAAAFWLRFHNLGALGFHGDEDHTYFAVKGVLETGYPRMPSGVIYSRGIPFTYVAALSATFFGLSEFSLRLPGVVFSLLTILLLYVLAREIFGQWVALLISALYALSGWNIEVARQARMYEMFLFLWVLSTHAFYRGFIKGEKKYQFLVPLLFIFTTTVHLLGILLLTLFCCPFLLKQYQIVSHRVLTAYAAIITAVNYWVRKIDHRPYADWFETSVIQTDVAPDAVAALPKELSLLNALLSTWNWQNGLIAALLVALSITAAWRLKEIAKRRAIHRWEWLAFICLVAATLTHQFGIAALIFACAVFKTHEGYAKLRDPVYATFIGFLCISFFIWAGWAFLDGPRIAAKEILKALLNPAFAFGLNRIFLVVPIMFVFVIGGLIVLFDRVSRKPIGGELVVIMGFVGPMVAMGVLGASPWTRHVYMVYPFFLMLYVWCIGSLVQYLLAPLRISVVRDSLWKTAAIATSVALTYALANKHSFPYASSISERTYMTKIHGQLLDLRIHPDHQSAGLFVKQRKGADDVVIVMDFVTAIYSAQMDYLLRTGGILRGIQAHTDIFTGSPILRNVQMLQEVIRPEPSKNIWLIGCAERLGPQRTQPGLSPEVTHFLALNKHRVVYTARDGITQVYLWKSEV